MRKKPIAKGAKKPAKVKQGKQTESTRDTGMSSDRPTARGRGQADRF